MTSQKINTDNISANDIVVNNNLSISNSTNHESASVQFNSTTKGLLIQRMTSEQMNNINNPANGLLVYNTTDSAFMYYNNTWSQVGGISTGRVPAIYYPTPPTPSERVKIGAQLANYVQDITNRTTPNLMPKLIAYEHGVNASSRAYHGGVYSPTQNRIYLMPHIQTSRSNWHYIDCNTGNIVAYTNIYSLSGNHEHYAGGVYSPTQNRIYLVPYVRYYDLEWHYIDCNTGDIVEYIHGANIVSGAYIGGVYSPTQNRIYFIPSSQASQSQWHYIDCNTGYIISYTHGVTASNSAYQGGVYSIVQNRIYLVPYRQASQLQWHYIDCNTGDVIAYIHGVTAVNNAYQGGVFSPTQNRIYLVPYGQAQQSSWHYIDCDTGDVVAYIHGVTDVVFGRSIGGVYSPTQNRIYFMPDAHFNNSYYLDCNTDTFKKIILSFLPPLISGYKGGVYSPTQNRIYFVPHETGVGTKWHYIDEYSNTQVDRLLMSGAIFNKF